MDVTLLDASRSCDSDIYPDCADFAESLKCLRQPKEWSAREGMALVRIAMALERISDLLDPEKRARADESRKRQKHFDIRQSIVDLRLAELMRDHPKPRSPVRYRIDGWVRRQLLAAGVSHASPESEIRKAVNALVLPAQIGKQGTKIENEYASWLRLRPESGR